MTATIPTTETGIVCGRCSRWENGTKVTVRHASVAAVRLCYGDTSGPIVKVDGPAVPVTTVRPTVDYPMMAMAGAVNVSDVTVRRVGALPPVPGARPAAPAACVCTDRDGFGHTCARFPNGTPVGDDTVEEFRNAQRAAIARTVREATARPATDRVPAGRYAIVDSEGRTRFYVVDRPTEGRWAGFTFVSEQAGDDLHPIRDRARRVGILAAIIVDPRGASVRYGQELGRCGVCNRTLTDPDSIAAGIGPVCAEKF